MKKISLSSRLVPTVLGIFLLGVGFQEPLQAQEKDVNLPKQTKQLEDSSIRFKENGRTIKLDPVQQKAAYWVVETHPGLQKEEKSPSTHHKQKGGDENETIMPYSVVRFYNAEGALIQEQRVEGIALNAAREKHIRKLNRMVKNSGTQFR